MSRFDQKRLEDLKKASSDTSDVEVVSCRRRRPTLRDGETGRRDQKGGKEKTYLGVRVVCRSDRFP
ncbi:hypothetical protein CSUI_009409 [Cystoisospora suis]|uniref:Uncharacterized protein n=1 Tax=Cystoisospora suis TaxID=483139 RepID=A0A2C6KJW8_9APIC|nr:hypothetical protein CSUI_009409 [Cystoisospora suis]